MRHIDDWTLLVVILLGSSIIRLTAVVTIIVGHRFNGSSSITIAVASILGIFAGVGGTSHGPGEILQGNIAPSGLELDSNEFSYPNPSGSIVETFLAPVVLTKTIKESTF